MNTRIFNRNDHGAPEDGWYQIEVAGEHTVGDGRIQVIDRAALDAMVAAFEEARSGQGDDFAGLLIDHDHLSHDPSQTTEAKGWLKEIRTTDNGLEGLIEWTDVGAEAVHNRRFKFFSTEYEPGDLEELGGGRVRPLRLAGLSLTNRPNNRGGKPISNREGEEAPAANQRQTETKNNDMQSIAEKLGLEPDASEEDILDAIGDLQTKVTEYEEDKAEAEAEDILNRHADKISEASRPKWKAQLITNRAATEELLDSLPEPRERSPQRDPEPIHNRTSRPARPAGGTESGTDGEAATKKAAAIRNRAHSISKSEGLPYSQAFDRAKAELG